MLTSTADPTLTVTSGRSTVVNPEILKGWNVRPEATFVRDQNRIFPTETRTPGYALFDVVASYTIARPHYAQVFSVNAFNLGDRLYRNHLSFIKDLAPEVGRGLRFSYTIRYF